MARKSQTRRRTAKIGPLSDKQMALGALGLIGLMVLGTGLLHLRAYAEAPPMANPPVSVAVQVVEYAKGYSVRERFAGRLEPARRTQLAFERSGLVTEVLRDEGDQVAVGEPVARLDTAQLETQNTRLQAQRAELSARLDLAQATLGRQQELATRGWQSKQKHDEARFSVVELTAAIARVEALISSIDIDLRKSELRAPYSGTVAARSIDEGAVVNAGAPVIELLEASARHVRVGVSVEAGRALKTGETYQLASGGETFEGRLITKRPDLQMGTRTLTVLLEAVGGENVPFGEIVELVLERDIQSPGLWLPISALSEGRKGLWTVFTVVERDGRKLIAREAVEVLHIQDQRVFVRGTVVAGAQVVLNGSNRIIPGQQVALAPAQ